MKTLYLVRHAKSSWQYDVDDHDRPLKGRGIRDAHLISQYFAQEMQQPDLILSSPATRALHTAIIFARNLQYPVSKIEIMEGLYLTSVKQHLEVIKSLDNKYSRVMLFGHNPALTGLVNSLAEHKIDNLPTTGAACFKLDGNSWAQIGPKNELLYFDYPKKRKKDI